MACCGRSCRHVNSLYSRMLIPTVSKEVWRTRLIPDLHLKALLHLGEDRELPHRHLGQVHGDVDLFHRLVEWDQVLPEYPELVEVYCRVVRHGLKVWVQVCLNLHETQRNDKAVPAQDVCELQLTPSLSALLIIQARSCPLMQMLQCCK